jgi:Icc-related predicted phosphoesterase
LSTCFFATDLHGRTDRYDKLFASLVSGRPAAVFLGGDLLPRGRLSTTSTDKDHGDFVHHYLIPSFTRVRDVLGKDYPAVFVILDNDDPRCEEASFLDAAGQGVWHYIHGRKALFAG